jgi:hypothetical protein
MIRNAQKGQLEAGWENLNNRTHIIDRCVVVWAATSPRTIIMSKEFLARPKVRRDRARADRQAIVDRAKREKRDVLTDRLADARGPSSRRHPSAGNGTYGAALTAPRHMPTPSAAAARRVTHMRPIRVEAAEPVGYHSAMIRARIRAAALAIVAAAGLVAVAPAGVAHADICRMAINPTVRFGPRGCTNPLWRTGFRGRGEALSQAPYTSWPIIGGNTWPPGG